MVDTRPFTRRYLAGFLILSLTVAGTAFAIPLQSWDRQAKHWKRFKLLAQFQDAAVLDTETGLVWQRQPYLDFVVVWHQAVHSCLLLSLGGRKGWRLPTTPELTSLVDTDSDGLQSPDPLIGIRNAFWSSTTAADDPTQAFAVDLSDGHLLHWPKIESFPIVCVRGGVGVP